MAATLKTVTLGCKVNQYETEYVRQGLHTIGYRDAVADEVADLCVVNTCTVTGEGDAKSRQTIRRLARKNPGTRIVVMGCYATRAKDELATLPNVAEVVTDKRELPDLLGRFGVVDLPDGISTFGRRQRAYVKVQDGCLLRCSFCIIPSVRPQMYSRPAPSILDEIRRLVDHGHREIVLTGVHLGHYGVDFNAGEPKSAWWRLSRLLKEVVNIPGAFRVRLSSIEATEVTRELIDVMGEFSDRVCSHLHICLQSGSDPVLRRMRRRWGAKRFVDRCSLVQERLDQPAITTDIMVGFPGETDEDFAATCRVAEDVGFSKIHAFPFSPRKGTPAADMPEQIHGDVKSQRMSQLAELEAKLRERYFRGLIGRELELLAESSAWNAGEAVHETQGETMLEGTTCRYAPASVPGEASDCGRLMAVAAVDYQGGRLLCNKAGPAS
ncbi:MAG: tRNA (N(6)-L-threonylcarbamoyladenosine(37)-C(2))-methylthiotransferase MtaB [Pirellulales bacterium]|nr:tRNA (N(6)-L-threonylcarbamoyladenosine(37)-C(2))-methylthiotransferase MtaB [Pirellulales bacterium]